MSRENLILIITAALFVITVGIDLFFVLTGKEKGKRYFRLFPLLVLFVGTLVAFPTKPLLYMALFAALAGEACLIFNNKKLLLVGLGLYIVEHALFILHMYLHSTSELPYPFYMVLGGFLLLFITISYFFLSKRLGVAGMIVGSVYYFAILLAFASAFAFIFAEATPMYAMLAAGYLVLIGSHTLLFMRNYYFKFKFQQTLIISLMFVAELLLTLFIFLM